MCVGAVINYSAVMPASLYNNQSQIHQSVGGYNHSSEINMDPIGGGIIDNRNGTGKWRYFSMFMQISIDSTEKIQVYRN